MVWSLWRQMWLLWFKICEISESTEQKCKLHRENISQCSVYNTHVWLLLKQHTITGRNDLSHLQTSQPHKGSQLRKPLITEAIYCNTLPGKSLNVSALFKLNVYDIVLRWQETSDVNPMLRVHEGLSMSAQADLNKVGIGTPSEVHVIHIMHPNIIHILYSFTPHSFSIKGTFP